MVDEPTTFAEQVFEFKRLLKIAIQAEVDAFHKKTGMTPSAIDVDFIDVSTMRDRASHREVGDVRVDFGSF